VRCARTDSGSAASVGDADLSDSQRPMALSESDKSASDRLEMISPAGEWVSGQVGVDLPTPGRGRH
jgi:hypothetical protein